MFYHYTPGARGLMSGFVRSVGICQVMSTTEACAVVPGEITMPAEKKAVIEKVRAREKERVQLDFASEALQRLDLLKEETGASTRAETIRQALRFYDWFIHETTPNSTIQITDQDGTVTSIFKASLLHNAARMS